MERLQHDPKSQPPERVLIAEANGTGHRLYYVQLLAAEASARGCAVFVALTNDSVDSSEFAAHLTRLPLNVQIVQQSDFSLAGLGVLSRQLGSTLNVIPDGDAAAMALARGQRWSGAGTVSILIMRESAQPTRWRAVQLAKTWVKQRAISHANRAPNVRIATLKSATWSGSSGLPVARDPVTLSGDDRSVADLSEAWSIGQDRYWFGILGAISLRKNLTVVADALSGINNAPLGLLIAGRCDPEALESAKEALQRLEASGAHVRIVDRILDEVELDSAVKLVDAVVLAHSNEGPSGLLGKAAAAGTRIVAAGAKSLRVDAAMIPSIASWSPLQLDSLSRAFEDALQRPRPSALKGLGPADFTGALL